MTIELNGTPRQIPDGTSVADLIREITGAERGTAAVVDGAVVPRSAWATTTLRAGQTVELVTAVQGG